MNNEVLFGICAVSVVIAFFALFFVFIKVKEFNKQLKLLESAIEKATNDNHQLQKILQASKEKERLDTAMNTEEINSVYREIKEIREMLKSDRAYFEEKLVRLDGKVRDYGHLSGSSDIDEKRIINLFQEGWSIDSIAKELRIGRGEVEFTLKLADITDF